MLPLIWLPPGPFETSHSHNLYHVDGEGSSFHLCDDVGFSCYFQVETSVSSVRKQIPLALTYKNSNNENGSSV